MCGTSPRLRIRCMEAPYILCSLSWMLPLICLLALILLAFGSGKHLRTHAIPLHSDPYCVHMLYTIVMWIPNLWLNFGSNFICAYQCHSWWQWMFEAYTQASVLVGGHANSADRMVLSFLIWLTKLTAKVGGELPSLHYLLQWLGQDLKRHYLIITSSKKPMQPRSPDPQVSKMQRTFSSSSGLSPAEDSISSIYIYI